jgi:4-amino-4-deoxy-L-arabinose transferase-like glycosyltransferase
VVLLPWITAFLFAALLLVLSPVLLRMWGLFVARYTRGRALSAGLVVAALAWLLYVAVRFALMVPLPSAGTLRGSLLDMGILGVTMVSALALVLVYGRAGLPHACQSFVGLLASRRGGFVALIIFVALWVGYEASVAVSMPWVGHADYADNAVVARNLVHGRGAVVDYVTQFYKLYPGITHPQETWPLLQPVWIAMSFMLFGINNWAAKIPNLVFITLLALAIYRVGARLWDRRVGLVAAILVLTSQFFFYLVIYTTTDLAFTLFAFGAVFFLYEGATSRESFTNIRIGRRAPKLNSRLHMWLESFDLRLLGSGVCAGLMLLQKPGSGVLIALGMALWFAAYTVYQACFAPVRRLSLFAATKQIASLVVWGVLALAILSPYLVRNVQLFDKPFYSTESYDAWVLGYGDWEDIYKIYMPEHGMSETGGTPNRSWLLRWGFDRALSKIDTQVTAVRNYMLPPWDDMPMHLSDVFSGGGLLYGAGAWLALIGFMAALRTRRALIMLMLTAFVPYTLFLVLYWHANEERYFVVLMPWLALLAGYALWRAYDHLARAHGGNWAPLGLALVLAAIFATVQPSWSRIDSKVKNEPRLLAADLDAYRWLHDNTPAGTVVMTRLPWQFNWAADRPALMTPNTASPVRFMMLAKYYHAQYLVRDTLQNPSDQTQQLINDLTKGPQPFLQKVYTTPPYQALDDKGRVATYRTVIYRFPANYANVAELHP